MKIHGTAEVAALSKKDFGVAFSSAGDTPTTPSAWIATGYGTSAPTISTTTGTNDTAQPTGDDSPTGNYSNGNALTTTTGNLKITLSGTFGEGGSLSNSAAGLTSITAAANVSSVSMRGALGGGSTMAMIRFNEPGYAIPNEDETNKVTCSNGDVFEIRNDGEGTATFYKNDSLFETKTSLISGDYQGFICSSDGLSGKFILPS